MTALEIHDDIARIDRDAWNALVEAQASATPFMRHEYLLALQTSGSATAETGWAPRILALHDRGRPERLLAACPLYLKDHSYGEYVFDWAWADAYRSRGLAYYPKLLCAVPFTPVGGPRLLATDDRQRDALLDAIVGLAREAGLSSAHLLFADPADQRAAQRAGWMARRTVQFHWLNRSPRPYADFDDFLSGMQRDKRRNIARERRKVAEAGVVVRPLVGDEIGPDDWEFFYRCYLLTYRAHRSTPYLSREFFASVAAALPECWLLFVAEREGRRIAASLIALDPRRRNAFGRYWGAVEAVECLHFEACYYQPLAWCIAHGYRRFEGGAQGQHKMARGLMPTLTASAHWLAHPQFGAAVAGYVERESEAVLAYVDELHEHSPYRQTGAAAQSA